MKKRILCILLIIIILTFMLFGCSGKAATGDVFLVSDNTFTLGVLLPFDDSYSTQVEQGVSFANSLAASVKLDEAVSIEYIASYYSDSSDVKAKAQELVDKGASVIVYGGDDYPSFNEFASFSAEIGLPVISLSPFEEKLESMFTLSLSPKYMSSCAATYAMDCGAKKLAVVSENSSDYYSDFARTFSSTIKSYMSVEPTLYYCEGEHENYSVSSVVSGDYDFLFLLSGSHNRQKLVSDLRSGGFSGKIMLTEVWEKNSVTDDKFNNCSFFSKLEPDSSNNISTVFYSTFSAFNTELSAEELSSAVAYGYDAYMTAFEALKLFAPTEVGSMFKNDNTESTQSCFNSRDIKASDYISALDTLLYQGVTDKISFKNNSSVTTYIYVDDISNGDCVFQKKYSFADN